MRMAKDGDEVAVHYRGTLDSGEEFDSSQGRDPLTFTLGQGQIIPGFENAVRGLMVGATATIHIEPDDAYGQRRDDLIFEVSADGAPEGLSAGDQVQLSDGTVATIAAVTDELVRIDANHPLAGMALNFEIALVSIK
ncbi:MAG: peptidylprolyl isomerase [SAR202 cluster bacterium]|nr:peptidylprolyl isomerase [SAR202 cluster bacterium]